MELLLLIHNVIKSNYSKIIKNIKLKNFNQNLNKKIKIILIVLIDMLDVLENFQFGNL